PDAAGRVHTLLSDVVRGYLEKRFEVQAARATKPGVLEAMRAAPQLTPAQQEVLREVPRRCDPGQFARAHPSPGEGPARGAEAPGACGERPPPARGAGGGERRGGRGRCAPPGPAGCVRPGPLRRRGLPSPGTPSRAAAPAPPGTTAGRCGAGSGGTSPPAP